MPRQQTRKQSLNTFSQGLITESNPLAYPDGSLVSGDNVDVLRDGSAKRRRGIDYEVGGSHSSASLPAGQLAGYAVSVHEWNSVDGQDDLNFLVMQIGDNLYFHRLGEDVLSSNIMGSINLGPIRTREDYFKDPIDADSGRGKLFVVGRGISPAYIQYNRDEDTFTGVKLTLKIRDVDGLEEDEDAPQVFGDDITPPLYPVSPPEDIQDIIDQLLDEYDFSPYVHVGGEFGGYF